MEVFAEQANMGIWPDVATTTAAGVVVAAVLAAGGWARSTYSRFKSMDASLTSSDHSLHSLQETTVEVRDEIRALCAKTEKHAVALETHNQRFEGLQREMHEGSRRFGKLDEKLGALAAVVEDTAREVKLLRENHKKP